VKINQIKNKLLAGEASFGTFGWEFLVPGLPQIVRSSGAEFLIYDMEHAGTGYETLKNQIALCRGIDLTPMCRVPTNQYHYISRALDLGCMGIMAPMVGSADEAEFIVSCTRYPPVGRRGAALGFTADDYKQVNIADTMAASNERVLVMAQIETQEGLHHVEEIAAVSGIDVLFLGHLDLTNFLGIPGQFTHPTYLEAVEKIANAARVHGKVLGCMSPSDEWSVQYWEFGFRMFAFGVDSMLLQSALSAGIGKLKTLTT